MAKYQGIQPLELTGFGIFQINLSDPVGKYQVYTNSTVALAAGQAINIIPVGTPTYGMEIEIFWEPTVTLANSATSLVNFFNAFTIKGDGTGTLPSIYSQTKFTITLFYDQSQWKYQITPSFDDEGFIDNNHIPAGEIDAVKLAGSIPFTSLAALSEGSILVGNSSNQATALDVKTSGQILIGNGTTLATVAQSGDGSFNTSGVFAIASDVVVNADINSAAAIAWSKMASLASANILVGNAGNVATVVAMSGDVNIDNAGATTIQADAVTGSKVASKTLTIDNFDQIQLHTVDSAAFTSANSAAKQTAAIITIAADDLHDTNTGLRIIVSGRTGATANAKTIGFDLVDSGGTTTLLTNTGTASPNNLAFRAELTFIRTSTTAYVAHGVFQFNGVAQQITSNITGSLGGGDDFDTNAVVINITALEGTPAGSEIIVETVVAEILR